MAIAEVNGLNIGYDVIGSGVQSWILTPGGRFARDTPGLRELAEQIASRADARVVIWDRPNCGESDVCFEGSTESDLNADTLVGLLEHLDMAPAVIAAGSAGARVSLLAEARHPGTARAIALWWPSGGAHELFTLGNVYCVPQTKAAFRGGMQDVASLPDWAEQIAKNPKNRQRILDQDVTVFIATMARWLRAFIPTDDEIIPGLPNEQLAKIDVPALVFNSGYSDANHPRWVSEAIADTMPRARLVDPPWGDREWWDRLAAAEADGLFSGWPQLAEPLVAWADEVLGAAV